MRVRRRNTPDIGIARNDNESLAIAEALNLISGNNPQLGTAANSSDGGGCGDKPSGCTITYLRHSLRNLN